MENKIGKLHTNFLKTFLFLVASYLLLYAIIQLESYDSVNIVKKQVEPFFKKYFRVTSQEYGYHEKWIVLSSETKFSKLWKNFSTISGWRLLVLVPVLPDNKLKIDATILDDNVLWSFGYSLGKLLPQNADSRLMLGYLFAISSGAQWIYTADHNSVPNIDSFLLDPIHEKLVSTELQSFNALRHFGQAGVSPTGFVNLSVSPQSSSYYLAKTKPVIQHILVNRKLYTADEPKKDFALDLFAPPVVLHPGTLSPFGIQRTLFRYDAFWALLGSHQSSGDVLQSYWIETLLKHTNGEIMFNTQDDHTPESFSTSPVSHFRRKNLEKTVKSMKNWKCKTQLFYSCLFGISRFFRRLKLDDGFLPGNDVILKTWLADLKNLMYKLPKFIKNRTITSNKSSEIVTFFPVFKDGRSPVSTKISSRIETTIGEVCSNFKLNSSFGEILKNAKPMYEDILLLITFNYKHSTIIPLLETMYRSAFPNMIICGNGHTDRKLAQKYDMSFYATDSYPFIETSNVPTCIIGAMKMNYKVKGYLDIHDDVMLNFWHLQRFNKSKIWYLPGDYYIVDALKLKQISKRTFQETAEDALWFFRPVESHIQAVEALMAIKNSPGGTTMSTCHKNLLNLTRKNYRYINGQSDIFYIPSRLADKYIMLMSLFAFSNVWLEIAIPTVTRCLEHPSDHETIRFGHIYGANIMKYYAYKEYMNKLQLPYYHPFKLEPLLKGEEKRRETFCMKVVPTIFDKLKENSNYTKT